MGTLFITGGTGSLGKAILKHQENLKSHDIKRIRVFSRDEQKQEQLEKSYTGSIELQCILGDITDKDRLHWALQGVTHVIHAAAQKIQPKMEYDVPTGFKNNIWGTKNLVENILDWNTRGQKIESALFVGTDKSCQPINSYGVSKLACEHLFLWANRVQNTTSFGCTRYGNVWGSRGSVVEHWHRAAKEGESLVLTDPRMTRFFIRLEDAATFVLQALFNNTKDLSIPNRMKSAGIMDLLEVIAPGSPYVLKGIREGEKLHEEIIDGVSSEHSPRYDHDELTRMYEEWVDA